MSTISAANISDGTDTVGTEYVVNGSARAYVSHQFSTTIHDSFNTSSVSDLGTGMARQVYVSAMATDENVATGNTQGGAHNTTFIFCEITFVTAAQREWNTGMSYSSGSNTLADNSTVHTAFGELA